MRRRCLVSTLAGTLLCLACSARAPSEPARPRRALKAGKTAPAAPAVPALDAHLITSVPAATYGPYTASNPRGSIALWAATDGTARSWYAAALDVNGRPKGPPARVAAADRELGVVTVRALANGFAVLFSRRTAGGDVAFVMQLGEDGRLRTEPTRLGESAGSILWCEVVATSGGGLAFWATKTGALADVYAAEIGSAGKSGRVVAKAASAWQVAPTGDGAALAIVTARDKQTSGPVQLLLVDRAGVPAGAPVVINAEPSAAFDLDMARVGARLLLAWSDHRDLETRVFLASADLTGKMAVPPRPATEPFGEQALVRVVPPLGAGRAAYLVWESLVTAPATGRALTIAEVSGDATLGTLRAELDMAAQDGSIPELQATHNGLAALTLAPLCQRKGDCASGPQVPSFVRFDSKLGVAAAEPMRLTTLAGEPATLAWGLSCENDHCFSLAAIGTTPAPVYGVRLEAKSSAWQAPARRRVTPEPPRAAALNAVEATEPLSDIDTVRIGSKLLTTWVTYFDPTAPSERLKKPAPDGRYEPLRAELKVRAFSDDGTLLRAQPLSLRARSLGGVSIARSTTHEEAVVGWTALDNAEPQVFLTLVAGDGRKLAQKLLTRRKGEASDVAIAPVSDGWLVAWVDERHGDPEVYLAKVNRTLTRVGPERRITTSPGAASGLSLATLGAETLLVWADAREAEQPGWADLYGLRVKIDGAPIGTEQRLLATRPHSHSPVLAPLGDGAAALAWIESGSPEASDDERSHVRVARLSSGLALEGNAAEIRPAAGVPSALALDCETQRCNVVLSVDFGTRSELMAARWSGGRATTPRPLASVASTGSQTVPPALAGKQLFYADEVHGRGLLRHMIIDWE